jgi:hypothetical protein
MDTTKQRKLLPLRKALYGLIRMLLEYVSRSHTGRFGFCYRACLRRYTLCIVAETRSGPLRVPHQKPLESHVLLEHSESFLHLNGAVHPEHNALLTVDARLHFFALAQKDFGYIQVLASFFERNLTRSLDTLGLMHSADTLYAGVHGCHDGIRP